MLRNEIQRLERLKSNIAALLRLLRAAAEVEKAVEGEVDSLIVAHPTLRLDLPEVNRKPRASAPSRPDSCQALLLRVHRQVGAAMTPREQRMALAEAGFTFSRQAVHAATRKLMAEGKLTRSGATSGRATWQYRIAGT